MRVVLPVVILLGVAACSREPDAPAQPENAAAPVSAPAAPTAEDSVAAVLQSSGRPQVAVRFAVEGKPVVGTPTPVRLDVSGDPGSLALRLQGEGLAIDPAGATLVLGDDRKPVSQTVTVNPRAAGIVELIVNIQPPGEAREVVYAIPLLVEGAPTR